MMASTLNIFVLDNTEQATSDQTPDAPLNRIINYFDVPDGSVALKVDCPFCPEEHTHGGGNDIDHVLLGSRSSHCSNGSYELVVDEHTSHEDVEWFV
jgi:hypothetical protein